MKRIIALLVLLCIPSWVSAGDIATDNFNRTDGGLGTNWATVPAQLAPAVVSNNLRINSVSATVSQAVYTAKALPNAQYVYATMTAIGSSNGVAGLILRGSSSAYTEYLATFRGPLGATSKLAVYRVNAGAGTTLIAEVTRPLTAGQVVKFTVTDYGDKASLRVFYDGVDQLGSVVDSTPIASGRAGVYLFTSIGTQANVQMDNWGAGSYNAGSPANTRTQALSRVPVGANIMLDETGLPMHDEAGSLMLDEVGNGLQRSPRQ